MTRLILLVAGLGVGVFACAKLLPIEAGDRATIAAGWAVRILIGAAVVELTICRRSGSSETG